MFHVKQPPEDVDIRVNGAAKSEATLPAALEAYRRLLLRYRDTLDLMSPQGLADLDAKLAEADRYAAAVGELAQPGGVLMDLGSGAGLPAVVVAARLGGWAHRWVERRRKRAAFLTQVVAHTGMGDRVRVVAADVQTLHRDEIGPVVAVTAQAVASLLRVAELTAHLWADDGVLLVSRKGPAWEAEVEALASAYRGQAEASVLRVEPLGTRGTLIAVRLTPSRT